MTLACPRCGRPADVPAPGPGQTVECEQCHTRFGLPPSQPPAPRRATPLLTQPPVFVPVPAHRNPFDFSDPADEAEQEEQRTERKEKRQERREEREERREERAIRGKERSGNMLGVAGLAVSATTAVMVVSGLLFSRVLAMYSGFVGSLAVPGAVGGLVCGLVAALRPGRSRVYGTVASCTSGLLLLMFIPLLFVLLSTPDPAAPTVRRW